MGRIGISALGGVIFAAAIVCLAGCSSHPSNIVGTWQVSTNLTVTFGPDGHVALNGPGTAPAFLAGLRDAGRWDVVPGGLRFTLPEPGAPQTTVKYDYGLENGGKVLRIDAGGKVWRFTRG